MDVDKEPFNVVALRMLTPPPIPTTTMSAPTHPLLFCMGNPLLDLQVSNGEALLKKYNLKANDAILAEEKHMGM